MPNSLNLSLKAKIALWMLASAVLSYVVFLYTTNPAWKAIEHTSYFFLIWGIVFVSCPMLWWLKNQSRVDGYEIGFSTMLALNLVAVSFLNPFLPQIGIHAFPFLGWHILPSYEAYVVSLALLPSIVLVEVAIYVACSAFIHAIKTKTLI